MNTQPHRDVLARNNLSWASIYCICVKRRGVGFHRTRDVKQDHFNRLPPTSRQHLVGHSLSEFGQSLITRGLLTRNSSFEPAVNICGNTTNSERQWISAEAIRHFSAGGLTEHWRDEPPRLNKTEVNKK